MAAVNPGRLAAVRALIQVDRGVHAEDALAALVPEDAADRALAWFITLGVLRRRGALDALLTRLARREMDKIEQAPRAALRMGLFELKLSRTAAFAAVDQAVEACRAAGGGRASGFVNAVLRKAANESLDDNPWLDLPDWLRQRWTGWDAWVGRAREPAGLSLVTRPGQSLADLGGDPVSAGGRQVHDATLISDARGSVDRLPGYAEGRWWVMDGASAAVADIVIDQVEAGASVLDACAAPGGKSFRMLSRGARVSAVDLSAARLIRVTESATRLGYALPTRAHDWLRGPLPEPERFDAVLVDAPCTGLGTIRRHPEIRWLRAPTDPAAMALRQLPILEAASTHVAPGGALIYSVCSPMPEEGEGVVSRLRGWAVTESWSSLPPVGDEDAFVAFVLRRVS